MRILAIMLTALALPMQAANAEANIPVAGHWTFTANLKIDCTFAGTGYLKPDGDGKYVGEITARQSCPSLPEDYLVRQDCNATRLGNQLSVRCRIVEYINGYNTGHYYPDNFTLTIASPRRMHGALVSQGGVKPAEWLRTEGGIS